MDFVRSIWIFVSDTLLNISSISIGVASLSLILGFIITFAVFFIVRDHGVPPGPTGLPILGWWPFINSARSHLQQIELKKKYGDIFSFRTPSVLFLNLASMKILKEAHITKTDYFRERTLDFTVIGDMFGDRDRAGVLLSRGEQWLTIRRFFLTQFRDRGMTLFKENTSETADETISSLVDDLRKYTNVPIDILEVLITKSNQMIRNTLFGLGSPVTEEEINSIQGKYRQLGKLIQAKNLLLTGSFVKYFIAPFLPFYKEGMKINNSARRKFQKMIDDHERTFDCDNLRDIIDYYIHERNLRKSKGDETYKYFSDETLVSNLIQFVGDGVVSAATFVTFMVMALLDNPEEQEKIYKELVEVCGEDRNATMADKVKLKYFSAFLFEAQRTTNFVPLFPSMECTEETTVGGFRIPKGSITVTNVYAIHNDPNVYEDPEKFNPSRFLEVDGKPREELPITFGVGKRVCLGESFVLMQVFLYLAAIVKNFKISYQVEKTNVEVMRTRTLNVMATPRK